MREAPEPTYYNIDSIADTHRAYFPGGYLDITLSLLAGGGYVLTKITRFDSGNFLKEPPQTFPTNEAAWFAFEQEVDLSPGRGRWR